MVIGSFAEKIYACIRKIPAGKVATYASVSRAIGHPKAFRATGNALNKNPYAPEAPCHRVVCSGGKIGGFAQGNKRKMQLLKSEGVEFMGQKIDLTRYEHKFKN